MRAGELPIDYMRRDSIGKCWPAREQTCARARIELNSKLFVNRLSPSLRTDWEFNSVKKPALERFELLRSASPVETLHYNYIDLSEFKIYYLLFQFSIQ